MTAETNSRQLDMFDLLPPSFRYQNRVRQVLRNWLAVVCSLVAVLCGITAATVLRLHQEKLKNERIASAAIPLIELRGDVLRSQQRNRQREHWCQRVEAARPGDDMLQTLAAIAATSQTADGAIVIDSVQVSHSIEVPASATSMPPWATPRIAIKARARPNAADAWLDRLNSCARIDAAELRAAALPGSGNDPADNGPEDTPDPDLGRAPQIEIAATPITSRVLP